MSVQDQLISPRYGGPIIGGIRDFITGAYLLTRDETILSQEEFFNLALLGGYSGPIPMHKGEKDGKKFYTGKQLFSLFLPNDFNFIITSKWNNQLKEREKM
jgi:DNA-directed RNA polymerase subunit A'